MEAVLFATREEERRRVIMSMRPSFWSSFASFVLCFGIILCFFLSIRLVTCCSKSGGSGEIMSKVPDGRIVLILLALAFAVSLQRPSSALHGLWAGLGAACVGTTVTAGFCGAKSISGSVLFLANAPVLAGVVLGMTQHNKTLDI